MKQTEVEKMIAIYGTITKEIIENHANGAEIDSVHQCIEILAGDLSALDSADSLGDAEAVKVILKRIAVVAAAGLVDNFDNVPMGL